MPRPNRILLLFTISSLSLSGANLTLSPEVIYQCREGLARLNVAWTDGPSRSEVRIGSPSGPSLTGVVAASGSAATGDWVSDGMRFYLVNPQGESFAQATARLRCGDSAGPRTGSLYPLEIGNRGVYRTDTRAVTADYFMYSITGAEQVRGQTYDRLVSDSGGLIARLRAEASGRILQLSGADEIVLLDPAPAPGEALSLPTFGTLAGVAHVTTRASLGRDERYYAPGLGPVKMESFLLSGSSGGFAFGQEASLSFRIE